MQMLAYLLQWKKLKFHIQSLLFSNLNKKNHKRISKYVNIICEELHLIFVLSKIMVSSTKIEASS